MLKQTGYSREAPLLPAILRFSIPLMLTGILQLAYNTADSIIVCLLYTSPRCPASPASLALRRYQAASPCQAAAWWESPEAAHTRKRLVRFCPGCIPTRPHRRSPYWAGCHPAVRHTATGTSRRGILGCLRPAAAFPAPSAGAEVPITCLLYTSNSILIDRRLFDLA